MNYPQNVKLFIFQRRRHQLERGRGKRLRRLQQVITASLCCIGSMLCLFGYFIYLRTERVIAPDSTFGMKGVIYVIILVVPLYTYLFIERSPFLLLKDYFSSLARKRKAA
jgi:hypothetical protein